MSWTGVLVYSFTSLMRRLSTDDEIFSQFCTQPATESRFSALRDGPSSYAPLPTSAVPCSPHIAKHGLSRPNTHDASCHQPPSGRQHMQADYAIASRTLQPRGAAKPPTGMGFLTMIDGDF
jgi:hypothetical protein